MLGILLVPLCLLAVYVATVRAREPPQTFKILLAGYVVRMVIITINTRDIQFFTHEAGGDSVGYEYLAGLISDQWTRLGLSWVTDDEIPRLGGIALPANIFALIIYFNGGPTRFGCTAFIAMVACLTCLNFLRLARELGADAKVAERVMTLILFLPSYLLYTSDMYKDGLVLFAVLGGVGSAIRLARKFSLFHMVFGVLCLVAVWYIRYYLVFLCIAPLAVGLVGIRSRSFFRPMVLSAAGLTALLVLASYTHTVEDAKRVATDTFDFAYGWRAQRANHMGGSGIYFDDGGDPMGALPAKLAYTLLAPFPWVSGSFGMHVGKIDTIIFYYFLYRALLAGKRLVKIDRGLLLTFLSFTVPTTITYALAVSNVGLILRQRMPIVVITILLATLSWPSKEGLAEPSGETLDDAEGNRLGDGLPVPAPEAE